MIVFGERARWLYAGFACRRKVPGMTLFTTGDLLWWTLRHNLPAAIPASGPRSITQSAH